MVAEQRLALGAVTPGARSLMLARHGDLGWAPEHEVRILPEREISRRRLVLVLFGLVTIFESVLKTNRDCDIKAAASLNCVLM